MAKILCQKLVASFSGIGLPVAQDGTVTRVYNGTQRIQKIELPNRNLIFIHSNIRKEYRLRDCYGNVVESAVTRWFWLTWETYNPLPMR